MSVFSLIIRKLFTMKILLWSHLVCILLGSVTSANHLFLPTAVKGKSRRFMDSKKSLIFKIIKDLQEEGPVRCFHYVIDSDGHVITHMIPKRRPPRPRSPMSKLKPKGPPLPDSELPVPLKIVDYRKIRLENCNHYLEIWFFTIYITVTILWLGAPTSSLNWPLWTKQTSSFLNLNLCFTPPLIIISFSLMLLRKKMQGFNLRNFSRINSLIRDKMYKHV